MYYKDLKYGDYFLFYNSKKELIGRFRRASRFTSDCIWIKDLTNTFPRMSKGKKSGAFYITDLVVLEKRYVIKT